MAICGVAADVPVLTRWPKLPISLKDSFSLAGLPSTVGFVFRSSDPIAKEHSALASLLLSAGAILYVKTTTPQGQLALDTDSALWGRTVNPRNTALSAGGSSGGEAALIAMRGSVLGVGTDLGGSIRIPASCCGIYGFKPTTRRIPRQGTETTEAPGSHYAGVATVCGPLATSTADCTWFLDVVNGLKPWTVDAQCVAHTFAVPPKKRLNIGLMKSDGVIAPLPPVEKMLDNLSSALTAAGHNVELISIPQFPAAYNTCNGFMVINGTTEIFDGMATTGESWSPWLAARMRRRAPKPTALNDFYKLSLQKHRFESEFLKQTWERGAGKAQLDVILCPVAGHPTTPHDAWVGTDYTIVWNLVDYPAGVGSLYC